MSMSSKIPEPALSVVVSVVVGVLVVRGVVVGSGVVGGGVVGRGQEVVGEIVPLKFPAG